MREVGSWSGRGRSGRRSSDVSDVQLLMSHAKTPLEASDVTHGRCARASAALVTVTPAMVLMERRAAKHHRFETKEMTRRRGKSAKKPHTCTRTSVGSSAVRSMSALRANAGRSLCGD